MDLFKSNFLDTTFYASRRLYLFFFSADSNVPPLPADAGRGIPPQSINAGEGPELSSDNGGNTGCSSPSGNDRNSYPTSSSPGTGRSTTLLQADTSWRSYSQAVAMGRRTCSPTVHASRRPRLRSAIADFGMCPSTTDTDSKARLSPASARGGTQPPSTASSRIRPSSTTFGGRASLPRVGTGSKNHQPPINAGDETCSSTAGIDYRPYLPSATFGRRTRILPVTTGSRTSNQLTQMGDYIHQQLLLANGRTHHELVQSVDCIHRQLMLKADYARTQEPLDRVEGRSYQKLLQMTGNVHYQLLMANSLPSHYGRQDVSQPVNVDGGYYGTKEQEVHLDTKDNGMIPDVSRDVSPSANADGGRSRAKEGTKEQDVSLPVYSGDGGLNGTKEGTNVDGGQNAHYQLQAADSPSRGCRQEDVSPPRDFSVMVDDETISDVSRDVSSSANADGGCSTPKEGTKEQDVSPLKEVDGGLYGNKEKSSVDGGHHVHYQLLMASSPSSGYRQGDVFPPITLDGDLHGAKEEGEEKKCHATTQHCTSVQHRALPRKPRVIQL